MAGNRICSRSETFQEIYHVRMIGDTPYLQVGWNHTGRHIWYAPPKRFVVMERHEDLETGDPYLIPRPRIQREIARYVDDLDLALFDGDSEPKRLRKWKQVATGVLQSYRKAKGLPTQASGYSKKRKVSGKDVCDDGSKRLEGTSEPARALHVESETGCCKLEATSDPTIKEEGATCNLLLPGMTLTPHSSQTARCRTVEVEGFQGGARTPTRAPATSTPLRAVSPWDDRLKSASSDNLSNLPCPGVEHEAVMALDKFTVAFLGAARVLVAKDMLDLAAKLTVLVEDALRASDVETLG